MRIQTPSPPNPYQNLFDEVEATGVVRRWVSAIIDQCNPAPDRPKRYSREEIQRRVKGTDRWGDVDHHCADVGDLHGFDTVFLDTGIAGHPQIMTLVHHAHQIIVTFHKTNSPREVKSAPKYIKRLIRDTQNRLLYVAEEAEDLTLAESFEGKTFIQVTYGFRKGDKLKQMPSWINLGIPDGDAARFYFQVDLLPMYPEFARAEDQIDLNAAQPARRFSVRPARKDGSEQ